MKMKDKYTPDYILDNNGNKIIKLCKICREAELKLINNCLTLILLTDEKDLIRNDKINQKEKIRRR